MKKKKLYCMYCGKELSQDTSDKRYDMHTGEALYKYVCTDIFTEQEKHVKAVSAYHAEREATKKNGEYMMASLVPTFLPRHTITDYI